MEGAKQDKIQAFALVLGACACVLLSVGFSGSSLSRSQRPCEIVLAEKINPNDAPVASLLRLPGIGPARAQAIVLYREDFTKDQRPGLAFRSPKDLQNIKGIGPKIVENMTTWLQFE